ncbi:MAG: Hpt domain-containing protein, partial [Anaeromyxobacteraceae bacterium]|nr:Hpt domain-containing protein [Anaeromyxobacteraceae bacterium]
MGVAEEIRQKLLPRFREMTTDRVEKLSAALLEREKGGGGKELLEELARELHTLKGEARMMGFAGISSLVHAAEDVLKASGGAPPKAALQALLEACDAIVPLIDQPVDGGAEAAEHLGRLKGLLGGGAGPSPTPPP